MFCIDPRTIWLWYTFPGFQGNSNVVYTEAAFEALQLGTNLCQNQQWHDVAVIILFGILLSVLWYHKHARGQDIAKVTHLN